MLRKRPLLCLAGLALLLGGCGSSSPSKSASTPITGATSSTSSEGGAALAADAKSAATGDIPDTQNFLTMSDPQLRVAMLYPEGWTVKQSSRQVSISDKNNLVRIDLAAGAPPTLASVGAALTALKSSTPTLTAGAEQTVKLKSGAAIKLTYRTQSAPNPVTGKQVTLTVDRYVLAHAGHVATVDLGTPVGVDNVDAYRRMIESFKWL